MSLHNLSKKSRRLTRPARGGEPSPMKRLIAGCVGMVVMSRASSLAAQTAALTSDLWRVAAGTQAAPGPFAAGATALLWNPVIDLPPGVDLRIGVTSIHAPEEVGVTGGAVALTLRVASSVVTAVWGRLGIDNITRTETSPEAVDGTIAVDAQVMALGVARHLAPWLDAGAALRVAAGRLAELTKSQAGLDAGVLARITPSLRVGFTARAFDPTGADASTYQLAAETRSGTFDAMGTPAFVRLRFGTQLQKGEEAAHLVTLGIGLGEGLQVDAGAAREAVAARAVWRSRIGVSVGTARYHVEFGRDGGVNGFGATYAFGLMAQLK